MFDELTIHDARPILWLKRFFVLVIVLLLVNGAVASHRAYFQVRSLELNAPQPITKNWLRWKRECSSSHLWSS